jgi:hypothetical protein
MKSSTSLITSFEIIFMALTTLFITGCTSFHVSPQLGVCLSIADLPQQEINEYSSVSKSFIQAYNTQDSSVIMQQLSLSIVNATDETQLKTLLNKLNETFGILTIHEPLEILKVTSSPNSNPVCTSSLSDKKMLFLHTPEYMSDYVVVIQRVENEKNSSAYFINHMVKENNKWKIVAFYVQSLDINGRDANYFLNIANNQLEKGNKRNAVFYYSISQGFLINNPLVQSSYFNEINDKIKTIKYQNIPQNQIEIWKTSDGYNFQVYKVEPVITHDDIAIRVKYITKSLDDKTTMKKESAVLAKYVKITFPEYADVFDGIIIQSSEKMPAKSETVPAWNEVFYFNELN